MDTHLRDIAIQQIVEAIEDEGPYPGWHRLTMKQHKRDWPTLWTGINNLMKAAKS